MSKEVPEAVRPYVSMGVPIEATSGGQWCGTCPYCAREKKFYVSQKTGQFDCKVCGQVGNAITFLTDLVDDLRDAPPSSSQWKRLSKHRDLPERELRAAGLVHDGSDWLIPIRSETGTVRDVRRYQMDSGVLKSTWGMSAQLFGLDALNVQQGGRTWLCEGEWDCIALRWLLRTAGRTEDVAVSVPGASVFKDAWAQYFSGRDVTVAFDNDDAGRKGAARVAERLRGIARRLRFVHWGDRPDGYDVRDFVTRCFKSGMTAEQTLRQLNEYCKADSVQKTGATPHDAKSMEPISFAELETALARHIHFYDDLRTSLWLVCATVIANDIKGSPLWLFLVGPPGFGKTMLLQTLTGTDLCIFQSTLTPRSLVSGWGSQSEDPSLLPRLSGRTFVLKDFTEILSMNKSDRDEIYSTLRGAYDGQVDKQFGNGVRRHYSKHSSPPFLGFNMIAGVTHRINKDDGEETSMGERFLRYQLREPSRDDHLKMMAASARAVGSQEFIEDASTEAMARYFSNDFDTRNLPTMPSALLDRIMNVAQLTGSLRVRVDRDRYRNDEVTYTPRIESATRLTAQLTKLAYSLAIAKGMTEVDESIYDVLVQVAYGTIHQQFKDVLKVVASNGRIDVNGVAEVMSMHPSTARRVVEDMTMIGVLCKTKLSRPGKVGRPSSVYSVSKQTEHLMRGAGLWKIKWRSSCGTSEHRDRARSTRTSRASRRRGS